MKILRFAYNGRTDYGVIDKGMIKKIIGPVFAEFSLDDEVIHAKEVKILAPVEPSKIVCVGLNYKDHAKELSMPIPDEPIIFLKPATSVIGHLDPIIYPKNIGRLDYEAEIAIVVKKTARDILENDAWDYILGCTCLNDVTARDLQKKDGQWTRAKSFDTFCPIGPVIETGAPGADTKIELFLNGENRQSSSLKNLIFGIPKLFSFISAVMTLLPGDVIATGTPPGVGPLKINDRVEVRVGGVGSLVNNIIEQP